MTPQQHVIPQQPLSFVDLARQYARYRSDIDERIQAVLEHGKFILGPEVAELEAALAAHCGAAHAVGAERAAAEVLSLPMHPFLEPAEQDRIIEVLASAVRPAT